ncbi:DUF2752 domain-containing protein [Tenacibaculum jejuense]|uniref:DUF2752 domain-containing protein n=1 Tax=Tenacibaculum jejuense TaxID=584609 RepID=A0A238UCR9_9FLAO|nr:DUF2752 domain-containing protein [Tenacibaculum jejuense]SNR16368.1 conserved protein of unknown function [Tenacibaculum jejuense]
MQDIKDNKKAEDYMLPCLNKKMFGIDCPGCGFQRSTVLVAKGEFKKAFNLFPAIYTSVFFILAIGLHFFLKKKITAKILLVIAIINVLTLIIAYLIKMNKLFLN